MNKGNLAIVLTIFFAVIVGWVLHEILPLIKRHIEKGMMGKVGYWREPSYGYFVRIKDVTATELMQSKKRKTFSWPSALCAHAMEWSHKRFGKDEDLSALTKYYNSYIENFGRWKKSELFIDHAMAGYSLIYLEQKIHSKEYLEAVNRIYAFVLSQPRLLTGVIPYRKCHRFALVDSLGMICPFLTRYGVTYNEPKAIALAERQLLDFIECGTDSNTGMPFHGYIPGKKGCIGLLGWGRGVGWYLIGLVDTLEYIPSFHNTRQSMIIALIKITDTLQEYQLENGAFSWAITNPYSHIDTSGTAMIAYAVERAIEMSLLSISYRDMVLKAQKFLVENTTSRGFLIGALEECSAVGVYPQRYGHRLWAQGPATALTSLVITQD